MVDLENSSLQVGDNKLFQGGSKRMVRLAVGTAPGSFTIPEFIWNFTYIQEESKEVLDEHILPDEFQRKRRIIDNHAPEWANAFFYDGGCKLDEENKIMKITVNYFQIPEGELPYALRLLKSFDGRTKEYKKLYAALLGEDL